MNLTRASWLLALAFSCKGGLGGGEPTRSYCEAVCDWAVSCHAADRAIDSDARLADCLTATEALDEGCGKASEGTMDPVAKAALAPCVEAVDAAASAGECDAFTGSIDDIKTGKPPGDCLSQGTDSQTTFDGAREATEETNDELCDRLTASFCEKTSACIIEDLGEIPADVITAMGGTPFELCQQRLDPVFTAECKSGGLYEDPDSLTDANATREAARECLRDFAAVTCDALFGSAELDPECAGSFSTEDQLLAVAGALSGLATDYADAMTSTP